MLECSEVIWSVYAKTVSGEKENTNVWFAKYMLIGSHSHLALWKEPSR